MTKKTYKSYKFRLYPNVEQSNSVGRSGSLKIRIKGVHFDEKES